jgi:CheY-like chemotaxis protein
MAFIIAAIDSQDRRRKVQSDLADAGHTVVTFSDGISALAEVVDGMPDAVVIGERLGDLASAQFCAAVQRHPHVAATPVVISSGDDLPQAVEDALGGSPESPHAAG